MPLSLIYIFGDLMSRFFILSFLPQVFGLSGWFLGKSGVAAAGSGPGWPSNRRKYGSAANVAVMKRLPESS